MPPLFSIISGAFVGFILGIGLIGFRILRFLTFRLGLAFRMTDQAGVGSSNPLRQAGLLSLIHICLIEWLLLFLLKRLVCSSL